MTNIKMMGDIIQVDNSIEIRDLENNTGVPNGVSGYGLAQRQAKERKQSKPYVSSQPP